MVSISRRVLSIERLNFGRRNSPFNLMEWRGIFVAANVGKKNNNCVMQYFIKRQSLVMLGAKDSQTGLVEPNRN